MWIFKVRILLATLVKCIFLQCLQHENFEFLDEKRSFLP